MYCCHINKESPAQDIKEANAKGKRRASTPSHKIGFFGDKQMGKCEGVRVEGEISFQMLFMRFESIPP